MAAIKYAELIDRLLNSCEYLEIRPGQIFSFEIPADNPLAFWWKQSFQMQDNKILKVTDFGNVDINGKMVERAFGYDFRTKGSIDPIFRVCNHGSRQSVNEPCHVHVGHEKNVIDCFENSIGKDFTYALKCVKNFYNNKKQDWDEIV